MRRQPPSPERRAGFLTLRFFSASLPMNLLLVTQLMAGQTAMAVKELPEGVRALVDVSYVSNGHERQKLDLYLPAAINGAPRPLLIRIHGGAWRHGDKSAQRSVANYVKKGYAAAAINYRFSQQAVFPAQIEDCKSAVRWLRAHAVQYGIDADRIVVMGTSAGGHLAALLGTTGDVKEFDVGENLERSSSVHAVVDFYGLTDFRLAVGTPGYEGIHSATSQLLGGPLKERLHLAAKANPISYISENDSPFLILHGDADPLVPLNQSERMCKALKAAGVPVEFHVVQGGEHGGEAFKTDEFKRILEEFLKSQMASGR